MSLMTLYNVWSGLAGDVHARMLAQALITAGYVLNEDPQTPNHAARAAWAGAVIAGTPDELQRMARELVHAAIGASPDFRAQVVAGATDQNIDVAIATAINVVASRYARSKLWISSW